MIVWTVGDRYIVPGFHTARLVRQTFEDERVAKGLENSTATMGHEWQPGAQWPVREIYEGEPSFLQPIVLGLALLGTIYLGSGAVGRWLGRRFEEVKPELGESDEQLVRRFRSFLDQF